MSYSDLARNLDTWNDDQDDGDPDDEDGAHEIPDWYVGPGGRADEGDD